MLTDLTSFLRKHFFLYFEDVFFGYLALIVLVVPLASSPYINTHLYLIIKVSFFYSLIGAALIAFYFKRHEFAINRKLLLLVAIFFLAAVLSVARSADLTVSIMGATLRWTGFLFFSCLLIFILGLVSSLNEDRAKFLTNVLIVTGLVNAVLSLFQIFGIGWY